MKERFNPVNSVKDGYQKMARQGAVLKADITIMIPQEIAKTIFPDTSRRVEGFANTTRGENEKYKEWKDRVGFREKVLESYDRELKLNQLPERVVNLEKVDLANAVPEYEQRFPEEMGMLDLCGVYPGKKYEEGFLNPYTYEVDNGYHGNIGEHCIAVANCA